MSRLRACLSHTHRNSRPPTLLVSLSLSHSRVSVSLSLSHSLFFCMSCGGKTTLLVQPAGLNRWSVRARTSLYTVEAHCFPVCKTARACFFLYVRCFFFSFLLSLSLESASVY